MTTGNYEPTQIAAYLDAPALAHTSPYPWADWTDGSPHVITRGQDFPADRGLQAFSRRLHVKAARLGLRVTVRQLPPDSLAFRFSAKGAE